MKNKITITITKLDDVSSVAESVELLFEKIINHYFDKKDYFNLETFILAMTVYLGEILKEFGFDKGETNGNSDQL